MKWACDIPEIVGWEKYRFGDQYPIGTKVECLHFGGLDKEYQVTTKGIFDKWGVCPISEGHAKRSTVTHIRVTEVPPVTEINSPNDGGNRSE